MWIEHVRTIEIGNVILFGELSKLLRHLVVSVGPEHHAAGLDVVEDLGTDGECRCARRLPRFLLAVGGVVLSGVVLSGVDRVLVVGRGGDTASIASDDDLGLLTGSEVLCW